MALSNHNTRYLQELDSLIDDAESAAASDWEEDFVSDMRMNFDRYRPNFVLSPEQLRKLEQIAGREL